MEMISATAFTFPAATKIKAIRQVIREALYGSFISPLPLDSQRLSLLAGNALSIASACRVLGATRIEPMAEEKVDAASPKGIIKAP